MNLWEFLAILIWPLSSSNICVWSFQGKENDIKIIFFLFYYSLLRKGRLTSWDFICNTVMIPAAPQETVREAGIETGTVEWQPGLS
jgi:hypothetical protein